MSVNSAIKRCFTLIKHECKRGQRQQRTFHSTWTSSVRDCFGCRWSWRCSAARTSFSACFASHSYHYSRFRSLSAQSNSCQDYCCFCSSMIGCLKSFCRSELMNCQVDSPWLCRMRIQKPITFITTHAFCPLAWMVYGLMTNEKAQLIHQKSIVFFIYSLCWLCHSFSPSLM